MGKLPILSIGEDNLEAAERIMAFIEPTELVMCTDIPSATLHCETLCIDATCRQAFWQGKFIELTLMEFDVFHLLARRPGRMFSQRKIYGFAAPDSSDGSQTGISSIIRKLRHKLNAGFIQIVYGKGYRFLPPQRPPKKNLDIPQNFGNKK